MSGKQHRQYYLILFVRTPLNCRRVVSKFLLLYGWIIITLLFCQARLISLT